jgi:hypothetical protein
VSHTGYTSNTSQRTVLTADRVHASQHGSGSIMALTPVEGSDVSKGSPRR